MHLISELSTSLIILSITFAGHIKQCLLKSDFKRHCLMWPANVIENIINEVLSSEIKCMTNNIIAKEQCEKTLFEISSTAKRYSRN